MEFYIILGLKSKKLAESVNLKDQSTRSEKKYSTEKRPFSRSFGIVPQVQYAVIRDALKASSNLFSFD